ncbi:ATP-dependent peptidase [Tanacetum coccineum]
MFQQVELSQNSYEASWSQARSKCNLLECSCYLEFPIPKHVAFIGEIGLGGELRVVPKMEKRVSTVAKLGYKTCVVPKSAEKVLQGLDFGDLEVLGCNNLKEVINNVFTTN